VASATPGSTSPRSCQSWPRPQALARSDYDAADVLAKLVLWTIMLFALQTAFGVLGSNPVSDLLRGLIAYLPNLFVAILIMVTAAAVARAVTDLLSNLPVAAAALPPSPAPPRWSFPAQRPPDDRRPLLLAQLALGPSRPGDDAQDPRRLGWLGWLGGAGVGDRCRTRVLDRP
jgi:Conserved TM helix